MTSLLLAASIVLRGAGGTFPEPVYREWFAEYEKAHPEVHFEYAAVGSGEGARRLADGLVDFAASDPPLSDEQLARQPGTVHVPAFVGGVVLAFRLPGVSRLRLSPEVIAGVFLGKIARWSDAQIAALNPGEALPDTPIAPVARKDESGTTQVFTGYLAGLDPGFKREVGTAKLVHWPAGTTASGSEGMAKAIAGTAGAIGYLELGHAQAAGLGIALIRNAVGDFVEPNARSISRASVGVRIPADFRVALVNARGLEAYPIATFTYLLFDPAKVPAEKREPLARFLDWALEHGQRSVEEHGNAPLPGLLVLQAKQSIDALRRPFPKAK